MSAAIASLATALVAALAELVRQAVDTRAHRRGQRRTRAGDREQPGDRRRGGPDRRTAGQRLDIGEGERTLPSAPARHTRTTSTSTSDAIETDDDPEGRR